MAIFTDPVKNPQAVKITGPFEPWAVDVLGGAPGFEAQIGPRPSIQVDGRPRPVGLMMTRTVDGASASFMAERGLRNRRSPVLVVAETITESARRTFEDNGVGYVDGRGNSHIRMPGLYVHTAGGRGSRVELQPPPTRLSGKAGLVAQALLLAPERDWQIAALAALCEVSTGLVHRVLARLQSLELVRVTGVGPSKRRHLARPAALLDLWAEEDEEPRTKAIAAYVLPVPGVPLASQCSKGFDAKSIFHAVTGIAAAAELAPALTSVQVTQVRVDPQVTIVSALSAVSAREVKDGANVLLLQAPTNAELQFRQHPRDAWLTANTRIYLDALRDPRRGAEQAAVFRQAMFGF